MPFLLLYKLCSYLLIVVGLLALLLPGELHPTTWLVALAAWAVSWFAEKPRIQKLAYRQFWTRTTTVLFFGMLAAGILGIMANPIHLGAYLLILLMINKLFNRLENRDYLHLYLISFLMLTLGTILNTDISYAFCFFLYVILITWTLTLFHLRREIENTFLLQHEDDDEAETQVEIDQVLQSRRLIPNSFLVITSILAMVIFIGSSIFFFVFPRVGFGLFFHRQRSGVQMSGFSNEVQLGSFGTIQQNRRVVMRVELPDQKEPKPELAYYWRGLGYDRYDGRSWKRSRRFYRAVDYFHPSEFRMGKMSVLERAKLTKQIIYQEPLQTPVLFGIDRVFSIKLPASLSSKVRQRLPQVKREVLSDSLTYTDLPAQSSSIRYTVKSVPMDVRPLPRLPQRWKARYRALFLQLPKKIDPRIRKLATRITKKDSTDYGKAQAVARYLRTNYTYSLTREPFQGSPLSNFLFEQNKGHCEYFSTALIILLRAAGVPARQVTGFYGASWNPYGNYYAVRQSNAHSWAEVMIDNKQWLRFDATPSRGPGGASRGMFSRVEEWVDAIRLRWYKWVIEYDLENQLAALRAVRQRLAGANGAYSGKSSTSWRKRLRGAGTWILLVLMLGVAIFLWRRRRGEEEEVMSFSEASLRYREALAMLAKKECPRAPHETPNEFLLRLHKDHAAVAIPMAQITEFYLMLRYDPSKAPIDLPTQFEAALQELEAILASIQSLQPEEVTLEPVATETS